MAMHLNENLDDNGEMHDINVTPFNRRDVGSADYLYGGGTVSDGRCEGELACFYQHAAAAPGKTGLSVGEGRQLDVYR
ncbi:biopolymer transport protein [Escherichia coli]|nr:biopolymer transport protein [Escherichia coli]